MKITIEIELVAAFAITEKLDQINSKNPDYYLPRLASDIRDAMLDQATPEELKQAANEPKIPF